MTRYEQGFIKRANQLGYSVNDLQKMAASKPHNEILAGIVPRMLPFGGLADSVGGIAGLFSGYGDDSEEDKNRSMGYNFLPGVGAFRFNKRKGRVVQKMRQLAKDTGDEDKVPQANNVAELLGGATTGMLGMGLGAALDSKDRLRGAAIGAGATGVAGLIAAIIAMAKKRRTDKEQLEKETAGRAVAKYLVPGLATYDSIMRAGKSRDYSE